MSDALRVVTIDGPSGGGKSTVSRGVAAKLGFTYLDTGAMYRAVGYACKQNNTHLDHPAALSDLLRDLRIELRPAVNAESDVQVFLNGVDISATIRTTEMGMQASRVSALPEVRRYLTRLQQQIGAVGEVVAEGRDTGTVVFPDALWKFYLDASPEIRAGRRAAQLRDRGEQVDEQELLKQIIQRDQDDSQRAIAPLKKADDAIFIDSSSLSAQEVINTMVKIIAEKAM
ncbi:(d)CMP kinase [Desulfogranum japonicum]|uniref:(d)CMP kinase n=1 Tax=Desulfogranum japonicum TaxID=231447 RepID=UPI00040E07BD|nr:(d)CMP kinase [Desulfogranum japonicum]